MFDRNQLAGFSELDDVHSVQIISEYCRSDKSSYYSYELNLVLNDGGRINVIDHGCIRTMREDFAALAKFLNKPVWDAA